MTKDQWQRIWKIIYPVLFIQIEVVAIAVYAVVNFSHRRIADGILCMIWIELIHLNEKHPR